MLACCAIAIFIVGQIILALTKLRRRIFGAPSAVTTYANNASSWRFESYDTPNNATHSTFALPSRNLRMARFLASHPFATAASAISIISIVFFSTSLAYAPPAITFEDLLKTAGAFCSALS